MPRKAKRRTRRKRGGTCESDNIKSYIEQIDSPEHKFQIKVHTEKDHPLKACPKVDVEGDGNTELWNLREDIKYYKSPFTEGNKDVIKRMKAGWGCGCIMPGCSAEKYKKVKTKMYNEIVDHLKTTYPGKTIEWDAGNRGKGIYTFSKRIKPDDDNYEEAMKDINQCDWDQFDQINTLTSGGRRRRKSRKKRRKSKRKKSRRKRKRSRRRRRRR